MDINSERPSIFIYTSGNYDTNVLKEITYGIEEESLFSLTAHQPTGTAQELSSKAASDSRLQVGIGIDESNISLHYRRMEKPLFFTSYSADNRKIGANGARLVKGVPLSL